MDGSVVMYRVITPDSEAEFEAYYAFRWLMLRKPWNYPLGSERDEYEQVAEHRMICDAKGAPIAIGRLHFNTPEEAQVRHVAVRDDAQGKGLGKMIVSALEGIARAQGVERLVTNSRESSIAFFKHCGFAIEKQATNELGQLQRKQMVKKLTEVNAIMVNADWCKELQSTWHETIPISEQMGIKLYQYTGRTLETRASLNKNINLHGTMFAGSIFSLATLTGWGMIFLQLRQLELKGEIVLGDGNIHYHKPVSRAPRATCHVESIKGKFELLARGKKSRITLQVSILDGDRPVAEFEGVYWVLPSKSDGSKAG